VKLKLKINNCDIKLLKHRISFNIMAELLWKVRIYNIFRYRKIHIFEKPSMRKWGVDSEVHIMYEYYVAMGSS
jgi:hypothetical protein